MQISLTSDDIGHGDLAAPAVAGLAAYFMSLDQYRVRLQVPGSVARNVRDLIKSLAYIRLPLRTQPAVAWNGIDSRQYHCPIRRDAESAGCPARNTTLPIGPPVRTTIPGGPAHPTKPGQSSVTSTSNSPPAGGTITVPSGSTPPGMVITVISSYNSPPPGMSITLTLSSNPPSSTTTDSSTSNDEGETSVISLGGPTQTVTII